MGYFDAVLTDPSAILGAPDGSGAACAISGFNGHCQIDVVFSGVARIYKNAVIKVRVTSGSLDALTLYGYRYGFINYFPSASNSGAGIYTFPASPRTENDNKVSLLIDPSYSNTVVIDSISLENASAPAESDHFTDGVWGATSAFNATISGLTNFYSTPDQVPTVCTQTGAGGACYFRPIFSSVPGPFPANTEITLYFDGLEPGDLSSIYIAYVTNAGVEQAWDRYNGINYQAMNALSYRTTRSSDRILIYLYPYGGKTVNLDAVSVSGAYVAPPMPDPNSSGNVLLDSGMEQQPVSSFWFPDPKDQRYTFGRINSSDLLQRMTFGLARCEAGFQIAGNWTCDNWYEFQCAAFQKSYSDVRQRFYWSGGVMYYRFSVRGSPTRAVPYRVYVTDLSTFSQTVLRSGTAGPADKNNLDSWDDLNGSSGSSLPGGQYEIHLGLGPGAAQNDVVFFDDVVVDTASISANVCAPVEPATTGTPTPTLQPSATPQGMAGGNLINNCGFSQGSSYWQWDNPRSFVVYDTAAHGNYGHENSDANNPAISQYFTWPGGPAFVQWDSKTAFNIYLTSLQTGQNYTLQSGNAAYSTWTTFRGAVDVPSGGYRINLHFPAGQGPAEFDNITVSTGNYVNCSAGESWTATPPPTSTPNQTPTMWPTPTQKPTSTPLPGGSTSTPRPTYTPYPSPTLITPQPPTVTPNPFHTFTPYPTYTARPTYSPYPTYTMQPTYTQQPTSTTEAGQPDPTERPTYTPWPTYTAPPPSATPPGQVPPPSYFADCNRPDNGADLAGWVEYEKCQTLSFFTWSPNAQSTMEAIPTMFAGSEPFGTMGELGETRNQVEALVNTYDWSSVSAGDPSIDDFLYPGANSPYNGGLFNLDGPPSTYSQVCDTELSRAVGPLLAKPICWLFDLLRTIGILPWLNLFLNIGFISLLLLYLKRRWVDAYAES